MELTRGQVRANRQKWIDFLMKPARRKEIGTLDAGKGFRCCLGHGCYALDLPRQHVVDPDGNEIFEYYGQSGVAPEGFVKRVGLYDQEGTTRYYGVWLGEWEVSSLIEVNDDTDATPQQIGEYLQSVIDGGEDTPFRPLSEYPESI